MLLTVCHACHDREAHGYTDPRDVAETDAEHLERLRTIRLGRPKVNAWQWGHADGVRDFAGAVRDWLLRERWAEPYGRTAVGADWHITTDAERHIAGELSSPTWGAAPLFIDDGGTAITPVVAVCDLPDSERLYRVRVLRNVFLLHDWFRVLYVCPRGLAYAAKVRDDVRADPRSAWTREDLLWLEPPTPGERVTLETGATTTAWRLLCAYAFAIDGSDALAAYRLSGHTPDDGPVRLNELRPTPDAVERTRRRFVEDTGVALIHLRNESGRRVQGTPKEYQDARDDAGAGRHDEPDRGSEARAVNVGLWVPDAKRYHKKDRKKPRLRVMVPLLGPGLDGGAVTRLTLEDIAAGMTMRGDSKPTDAQHDEPFTSDDREKAAMMDLDGIRGKIMQSRGATPHQVRWVAENGLCPVCQSPWDFAKGDRCTKPCGLRIDPDRLARATAEKKMSEKSV
ncbi:MAG: hypothetical protein GX591_11790 [Planctomycetes bacterium]|nr:hypothetical protein [Planctomycetota bacterium]